MEAYKFWVRKNKDFVHSLESLANGMTWLLPERFSNSEIGPEAVYAILAIVSTVNQHIIDAAPTRGLPRSTESYPWSLLISVLKDAESVIEVASQYFFGDSGKWNFLLATEGAKALVRLGAFHDSGFKMLLQGGELVNEEKHLNLPMGVHSSSPGSGHSNGHAIDRSAYANKNLEGRAVTALNRFGDTAKMWKNKHQREHEPAILVVEKPKFSNYWNKKGHPGRLFLVGEVICIIRPLLYIIFIRKFGTRSWVPWLVSLATDITGMYILSHATTEHGAGDNYYHLSSSEKMELKRRKLMWALYVMRDPFFFKHTKGRLEKAERVVAPVPLIGFFVAKAVELLVGAQTRYTYTSGS